MLKSLIKKILLAFEQSSTSIKYSEVYKYNDGPDKIKQITLSFGITEYGNLKTLLRTYCLRGGVYCAAITPYINDIGVKSLVKEQPLLDALKAAGSDPVMQQCQDEAFDSMYIDPALGFCSKNQLELPLSKLVICDSYLHSGSILNSIRSKFSEVLPVKGGDEKAWITAYCKARRYWLANNSNTILHNTVKRMDFMLARIEKGDWELTQSPFIANDVKIV